MRSNVQVRTGNRFLLVMDGQVIGGAKNARLSSDYAPEAVYGIGDINPIENCPTAARHSVSVTQVAIDRKTMLAKGLIPENGDGALRGMVFDIIVQDKATGEVLRKFIGCSYASGDIEVNANQVSMLTGQFNALDVQGATL